MRPGLRVQQVGMAAPPHCGAADVRGFEMDEVMTVDVAMGRLER